MSVLARQPRFALGAHASLERRSEEARLTRAGTAAAACFEDDGPVGADQVHVLPMLFVGHPWAERRLRRSRRLSEDEDALSEAGAEDEHIVAPSLCENSLALIHGVNALRHRALAASGCPGPKDCRRYPAIEGCSTRST